MARKQTGRHSAQQTGKDFPGYPHYDKKEDIMDGRSKAERVNVDVENLPSFHNATTAHRLNRTDNELNDIPSQAENNDAGNGLDIQMGTEADISAEERIMLEDDMYYPTQDEDRLRQARLDDTDFDGEKLNENSFGSGQAESGDDLDMDITADETKNEMIGEGDEENQYWSLGSAENDNIVEGTP
jgi:hypothetical protein